VVADTTYTSVYWKTMPCTFCRSRSAPAVRTIPTTLSTKTNRCMPEPLSSGAHPIAGLKRSWATLWPASIPTSLWVKFQTFQQQIGRPASLTSGSSRVSLRSFGPAGASARRIGLLWRHSLYVAAGTPEIGHTLWRWEPARSRVIERSCAEAMLQAVAGLAIGVPVAIFCVRYVKSQLYEITSVNVPVMTIAIGVLALAAAMPASIRRRRAGLHRTPYGPCGIE